MTSDKQDLTAERLRELLDYDPETGVFTRKVRTTNSVKVGDVAGTLCANGYIYISINSHRYLANRLAWLYVHGRWPAADIDHVNGSPSDNRLANLREATRSENLQNRQRAAAHNKTGYLGVHARRGGFKAAIRVNGKQKHLGDFKTAEEAYAAYLKAKRQIHPFGTL